MNLTRFPRRRYIFGPTPIEPMHRLTTRTGGPQLFIKRDDTLPLAGGGNKTRKLEFLMADALAQGADMIITCGAVQSNHCRLTLAAAVREGLGCHLVLEERVPKSYSPTANGNNFLFNLLGVSGVSVVPADSDMDAAMLAVAERLKADGHRPYIIPGGGSNSLGALGYVACADEILTQAFDLGLTIDAVVCASGSGGTHSGLVAGFLAEHAGIPVVGINVRRSNDAQVPMIRNHVQEVLEFLDVPVKVPDDAVVCFDGYVGPGYSLPTPEMVEAVDLVAKTEGILLDPVYTGKAMAGMLDLIKRGYFHKGQNVLFLHTGGSPALYAYTPLFFEHFGGAAHEHDIDLYASHGHTTP